MKILTQDNQLPGPDLNPGPPDYEAEVLLIRLRRTVPVLC
jgi:hypothetical protein